MPNVRIFTIWKTRSSGLRKNQLTGFHIIHILEFKGFLPMRISELTRIHFTETVIQSTFNRAS